MSIRNVVLAIFCTALISACQSSSTSSVQSAIQDVQSRPNLFPDYPLKNSTYLTFSKAHGFQISYLSANGKSWLWYPGNRVGVPEEWKVDRVKSAMCWRHPTNTYNPVIKAKGGDFACQSLLLTQRSVVARLAGDPFHLANGTIPYQRRKCDAPTAFKFDRTLIKC